MVSTAVFSGNARKEWYRAALVKWDDSGAGFMLERNGEQTGLSPTTDDDVIGNTYENPELLGNQHTSTDNPELLEGLRSITD